MMNREQRDQALFDKIAPYYARKDTVLSSSLARKSQLFAALQSVLRHCSHFDTVVDVGCGVGAAARYLDGLYERYIGIDQSAELIKAAVTFNAGNHRAEFIAANIKLAAVPPHTADLVLSDGALHHMIGLDEVMECLITLAKPGAFLVAREPQNGNPFIQLLRWLRGRTDASYSREQLFFAEGQLSALLRRHGLTGLQIEYQGFCVPPFAQVVLPPQMVMTPLSRLAARMDGWLHTHLPRPLKRLSFNIVVTAVFPPCAPTTPATDETGFDETSFVGQE
jgi:SAM-dependent methyltransferase